ncbi:MAG: cupin domain-containing protein [Deltaproteobacteria bacterium]|nr:cupin domain-containing protein [Deltaproteobacteria bacterium]
MERERAERKESELSENMRIYDPENYHYAERWIRRQTEGAVVVRGKERPYDVHKQNVSRRYLSPCEPELADTVLQDWEVFLAKFTGRSGKHRHQGGLVIFILEGSGYSVLDGERFDWEAGDLVVLPLKPDRVEHQHFANPGEMVKWIAFIYWPFFNHAGCEITQMDACPLYEEVMRGEHPDIK